MAVEWVITPSKGIADELSKRTRAMDPALNALATSHALRGEATMKSGRTWTDRTGYARGSLYGRAHGTDIHLGTTNAKYGIYLELGTRYMQARPIIKPTADWLAPKYFKDAGTLVSRLLGGK